MLRRNLSSVFVAGAFVFPGGAVDDADRARRRRAARAPASTTATASRLLASARGWARGSGSPRSASPSRRPASCSPRTRRRGRRSTPDVGLDCARRDAVEPVSARLLGRPRSRAGLLLDVGRAARVLALDHPESGAAAATTPGSSSRRAPTVTPTATTTARRSRPSGCEPADCARHRAAAGELELIFPTQRSLEALARFATAADLFAAVDAVRDDPTTATRRIVDRTRRQAGPLPGDDLGVDDACGRTRSARRRRPAAASSRGSRADARHDPRSAERALAARAARSSPRTPVR